MWDVDSTSIVSIGILVNGLIAKTLDQYNLKELMISLNDPHETITRENPLKML